MKVKFVIIGDVGPTVENEKFFFFLGVKSDFVQPKLLNEIVFWHHLLI